MKKEKTNAKIETDTEMLARMLVNGFEKIDERFEKIDERFEKMEEKIEQVKEEMNNRFEDVEIRLTSINLEQKETNRRLDTMERHQKGMLDSLDETVHRNEFARLEKRVEVLEG